MELVQEKAEKEKASPYNAIMIIPRNTSASFTHPKHWMSIVSSFEAFTAGRDAKTNLKA